MSHSDKLTGQKLIQRSAIAMMESPEWPGIGDLKLAHRLMTLAIEVHGPPDVIAGIIQAHKDAEERNKQLNDFDSIWPI